MTTRMPLENRMRTIRPGGVLACAALLVVACDHAAPAPPTAAATAVSPASATPAAPEPTSCERLATLAFPHVAVTEARDVPASAASPKGAPALPASCRVHGVARPTSDSEIGFEVVIPAGAAWNGRYMQVGSGGFAGAIPEDDLLDAVAAGYAAAGTDDGHRAAITDASWALGHPEKLKDFGYRALKETTDAARAIVLAYAGRAPARSYFVGCSDGGREALMEAQRYPDDFDGIVAGAPANHWTRIFVGAVWVEQAILATPKSYLPSSKLAALEAAALAACGDEDKVIEDPLACHFDPSKLRCKGADSDRCLTDAQLKAVRAIYAGPKVPATSAPIMPGYEPGSEGEDGGWHDWIVGKAPGAAGGAAMYLFAQSFFRNVVFADTNYDIRRFQFDADVAATDALAPVLDAYDTDLGAFQKHGGKLIQYHGWGDAAIPPRDSIAYYQGVQTKMGDTSAFYRLFMAPGMLHCGGGTGPNVLATLPAITDWVEHAKAPDQLLATKMTGEGANAHVARTRPLCPYPLQARWDGKGDRARAESYGCGARVAK